MVESIRYWTMDLFSAIWLPVLFILVAGKVLSKIHRGSDKKHSQEVIGIALGVILGFVSQVTIGSFDEFRKEQQFKQAANRLLQQYAENIYRNMWLFDGLLKIKSPATEGMDRSIPPRIDMPYWETLKKNSSFLFLARDERFAKIFYDFWQLEEIYHLLDKGHAGDKEAARMAIAIYHAALRHQAHRTLLLRFITTEEIGELDRKHKERMAVRK